MTATAAPQAAPRRARIPLFVWIIIALILGTGFGSLFHYGVFGLNKAQAAGPRVISAMVLNALQTLAIPLIFLAIMLALLRAQITGRKGARLVWLIMTNTLVAILIGVTVANLLQPGAGADLHPTKQEQEYIEGRKQFDVVNDLVMRLIPKSILGPFVANDVLGIVVMAIVFALALRAWRRRDLRGEAMVGNLQSIMETFFEMVLIVLHWLFYLVPFAVLAVVTAVVGEKGFEAFVPYGKFILAVLLALFLQMVFYLARMRLNSWVRPPHFLRGSADALATAFSTASSAATLPVTYRCAAEKIGVRDENARLGTMVGGNLNNDGTALYEALAALFVAQALGMNLGVTEQIVIVFMSVIASMGAAGIPEAGLVTMMAVFTAVKLPTEYIMSLLAVDWFLDRCRTAINVMGDLAVSSILDGKTRQSAADPPASVIQSSPAP